MKPRPFFALALLLAAVPGGGYPCFAQQPDPANASQPAQPSPERLKSGTIYQIFERSFSTAGDLNGVTARLDDLQAPGVNILLLMPIHPYGQAKKKGSLGSLYAVRDNYAIDAPPGKKDDLRRLVQQARQRQMKVIIDMVANHTSWDNVMWRIRGLCSAARL
jgi:cyclomaltodextrinase / maltogenic alpha-amylase / neopullulanase